MSSYNGKTERVDCNDDIIYPTIVILPLLGDFTFRRGNLLFAIRHHILVLQVQVPFYPLDTHRGGVDLGEGLEEGLTR